MWFENLSKPFPLCCVCQGVILEEATVNQDYVIRQLIQDFDKSEGKSQKEKTTGDKK